MAEKIKYSYVIFTLAASKFIKPGKITDIINSALRYEYSDYTYFSKPVATGNVIRYTVNFAATEQNSVIYDLSRFIGAIYRQQQENPKNVVDTIQFDGTTYYWDEALELSGSNWVDANGKTLISVLSDTYKDAIDNQEPVNFSILIEKQQIKFKIEYPEQTYVVKFEPNDHVQGYDSEYTVSKNTVVKLVGNMLVVGNIEVPLTISKGFEITGFEELTIVANTTIAFNAVKKSYVVTFGQNLYTVDYGTEIKFEKPVLYIGLMPVLIELTEGYKFGTFATKVVTANVSIEVPLLPIEYTISFDVQGGNAIQAIRAKYNIEYILPSASKDPVEGEKTITSYEFINWTVNGTEYAAGSSVKNLTLEDGATVVLTAQWSETTEAKPVEYGDAYVGYVPFTNASELTSGQAKSITKHAEYLMNAGVVLPYAGYKAEGDKEKFNAELEACVPSTIEEVVEYLDITVFEVKDNLSIIVASDDRRDSGSFPYSGIAYVAIKDGTYRIKSANYYMQDGSDNGESISFRNTKLLNNGYTLYYIMGSGTDAAISVGGGSSQTPHIILEKLV